MIDTTVWIESFLQALDACREQVLEELGIGSDFEYTKLY